MNVFSRILAFCFCMFSAGVAAAADAPTSRPVIPPPKPGVLRIVCFGDSITGDRPFKAYQNQYIKFSDLIQMLGEFKLGAGKVEVLNAGWAGDCTYPKPGQSFPGAVGRLQSDVLDIKADIAVVLISGNDAKKTDADRELTRKNLKDIATRINAAGIKLLMLQYHDCLPAPENAAKGWHLSAANDLIVEAAASVNAPTLDMNAPMLAAVAIYPRGEIANAIDGVHLNARGEIVFAQAIFAKLVDLGWLQEKKLDGK